MDYYTELHEEDKEFHGELIMNAAGAHLHHVPSPVYACNTSYIKGAVAKHHKDAK